MFGAGSFKNVGEDFTSSGNLLQIIDEKYQGADFKKNKVLNGAIFAQNGNTGDIYDLAFVDNCVVFAGEFESV